MSDAAKPEALLIHGGCQGGCQGGWAWLRVIPALAALGVPARGAVASLAGQVAAVVRACGAGRAFGGWVCNDGAAERVRNVCAG